LLGASSGDLEGRAVFYKDVLLNGGDLLVPTGNILLGPSNTALNLADELLNREPPFIAISPLKNVFSFVDNEFQLKLDEMLKLKASSFETGKFRLSSPNDDSVRIQRFDDDGSTITDAWQDVAMFQWDDSLGGSMLVNKIKSRTTANVVFGDTALMDAGAIVNGTLSATDSNLQNIRGVNAVFAKDDTGIGFHPLGGSVALEVENNGNIKAHQILNVLGNISCSGTTPSPYWVAGRINGITQTILSSKGKHDFTFARTQTGYYRISWGTAHPDGTNFIVFAQGEGTGSTWNILHNANSTTLANGARTVTFICRDNGFNITDGIINFAVLS
jgi:hypothetical protein